MDAGFCGDSVRLWCEFVWILCGFCADCMDSVQILLGFCKDPVRVLCGFCKDFIRILCGFCKDAL